jgi:hypothetical protein
MESIQHATSVADTLHIGLERQKLHRVVVNIRQCNGTDGSSLITQAQFTTSFSLNNAAYVRTWYVGSVVDNGLGSERVP